MLDDMSQEVLKFSELLPHKFAARKIQDSRQEMSQRFSFRPKCGE